MSKTTIQVSIMHQDFTVSCEEEIAQSLTEAASYLDREMRSMGKVGQGRDRTAVMAALNITHDYLSLKEQVNQESTVGRRLTKLHDKVDKMVIDLQQVSL